MKVLEDLVSGSVGMPGRRGTPPPGMESVKNLVQRGTKLDATQVVDYWANSTQTIWEYADFPCCAPPWDIFTVFMRMPDKVLAEGGWQECRYSGAQSAFFCRAYEPSFGQAKEWLRDHPRAAEVASKVRWMIGCVPFVYAERATNALGCMCSIFVDGDGGVLEQVLTTDSSHHLIDYQALLNEGLLSPLMLAISFANCKNVDQSEQVIEKRGAKFKKRDRCPRITYKTLEIDGQKQAMAEALEESGGSVQKALHICRGHFATYTDEAPLFGKHTGTFWVPMHTRGKRVNGRVVKDYRVKA